MAAILITEPVHELLPEGLRKLGFEVIHEEDIQRTEVLTIINRFHGLIINSKIVADKELLDSAPQLRFVARCGSGKEVMDIAYAESKGITCITSPEGNCQAVAEQAIGMLLSIMNNIPQAIREVNAGKWLREKNRGYELSGKTVGIVGYGHTGQSSAKLLSSFSVKVLAYDKYKTGFSDAYAQESDMENLFHQADVVSLHLPLSDETKHFANKAFFDAFQKNIWFLNTARGANVDTAALLGALDNGKVIATALDVLENEKLDKLSAIEKKWFDELISRENVIITPHIAGWTHESKRKIAEVLLQKIAALAL